MRYALRVTRPISEIGLAVKRLQMKHHRAANARLAQLGLSLVQWDALRHLDENPDASLHDLQAGGFAINGHKSPQEATVYVYCGEIPAM